MIITEKPASMIAVGMEEKEATVNVIKMIILADMMDSMMITLDNQFTQKDKMMNNAYRRHLGKKFGKDIAEFFDIDYDSDSPDLENMQKLIDDDIEYYLKSTSKK